MVKNPSSAPVQPTSQSSNSGQPPKVTPNPIAKDDSAALSENGTALIQVLANDLAGGAKQLYSLHQTQPQVVTSAAFSKAGASIVFGANGAVLYTANGSAFEALAKGETLVDTFIYTLRVANGTLSTATVTVTVTGTNDGPVIGVADLVGAVTEAVTPAGNLIDSGTIAFSDVDVTDTHTASAAAIGTTLGGLTASVAAGQITWNYSVTAAALEFLAAGQIRVESFTVTLNDRNGGVVTRQVDVTLTGTNDGPVIGVADLVGAVTEAVTPAGNLIDSGTIAFSDVDVTDTHTASAAAIGTTLGGLTASVAAGQITWNYSVTAAALEFLAAGQIRVESFTVTLNDRNGGVVTRQVDVTLTGTNDRPVVVSALSSNTNEDAAPYSLHLLAGASDVDHGSVLRAAGITEASGKGGWSIAGDVITINPDYFGDDLNNGQFENLNFSYQVVDEHGASVAQSLKVNIQGITDAPSLAVTTKAGIRVNEVILSITSQPARNERVALTFSDVPAGASILDAQTGQDVTGGLQSYSGTREFKLVLAAGTDEYDDLAITVTGYRADNSAIAAAVQTIDLAYDVVATTDTLNFSSDNQNIWGNFPGYIEFHEYIPFVGGTPMVWDANTKTWTDVASDYWRSGKFSLVDTQLDTNKIVAVAQGQAKGVLDAAKLVFDTTAYVIDKAAQLAFDTAKTTFGAAEYTFWFVARGVDQAVKNTFQAAQGTYAWAQGEYGKAWHAFDVVAKGVYNVASSAYQGFMDYYNSFIPSARWLNDGIKWVADGLWGLAQGAYNLANNTWADVKTWFDDTATVIYNAAVTEYNRLAGAVEQAAIDTFNLAKTELAKAEHKYNDAKAWVLGEAQKVYDGVQNGVNKILAEVGSKVDFNSKLTVEADVFAKVGLQVDMVLDLGSVDTSIDYQLTSTTQYNKTTDMLAITPLMANKTTGATVAFNTISPNAKFYIALHYDAGADFDVLLDGHLRIDGRTEYDLTPGSNAPIDLGTTASPKALVENVKSLVPGLDLGAQLDVGKLVLVDFDSTKTKPFEVPFITTLSKDVVTITVAFPTVTTQGTEAAYSRSHYEEGGLVAVDFSEISGAIFNLVNARLDYSPELKVKIPGLGTLRDVGNFNQLVDSALKAFMGTLLDVLDGQSEEVPIFLLDGTDQTNTSLLLLNLWPDSASTSTLNGNTASLGFYASYGESAPVFHFNFDIDQAIALVVNEIVKAALKVASSGSAISVLEAIPTINPLNFTLGLDTILKVLQLDAGSRDIIGKFLDLNLNFQAADLDAEATAKFSQKFTLSIDDMSYLVTLEDGTQQTFTANGAGGLLIANASSHDANGDGSIAYTLDIVPTAMFSNDTELGFGVGYTLDFMKGSVAAGIKLPLGQLLGISADWLTVNIPLVDVALGPLLRVQGDLDILDIDVFEARFALDVGSDSFASTVDIKLVGVNNVVV